ncbi:DNA polymerase Y family protein [Devosia sp. BK]|uniref:Y-family DNA polymerase n=1 Tax=Devosia sp. BK TaxID=2871706 RepID=UPI00293A4C2F|nr:DNA polymerase Y family protein [Devosia sp. BK]MDV3252334.1 DNA polymerase Y family protein [Devosia sp. BK]
MERRFLSLFLPNWPTDYFKRRDPDLKSPLALYEKIKGGLRLAAIDAEAAANSLRVGQSLADARALVPALTVKEIDRPLLEAGFGDFADWHSNTSPLVSVLTDANPFGDLLLDITGVPHLFDGERAMLDMAVNRLKHLGYAASGAIAPTIGGAWAASHFAPGRIISASGLANFMDALPIAALRLNADQVATLTQMGLTTISQVRHRPRRRLQAILEQSFLIRLDQAYGHIEERMTPRLPAIEHFVERRFFEPISVLDDVLGIAEDLAKNLCAKLETYGLGAQTFHLFLYRVDHKVMTLSLNAARLTRDASHIASLFRHRAEKLERENYDPGFGIDLVRLAASSLDKLNASQMGAFETENGAEDIDRLADRLGSRLGSGAILKIDFVQSYLPERATRLTPALTTEQSALADWPKQRRPMRLLPRPELVKINAEVPHGLPASMIWRHQAYRLIKGAGPERIGAEWWRSRKRLELVEPKETEKPEPGEKPKPPPYIPNLSLFDPSADMRDYYLVEDEDGHRYWVFRLGFYDNHIGANWYLHGFFP